VQVLLSTPPSCALEAYAKLPAEQKLALLLVLVEAACDTPAGSKAVEQRLNWRNELANRHEAEEREQKKETRRKKEELRAAARAKLASSALVEHADDADGADEGAEVTEWKVTSEVLKLEEANACGGNVTVLTRDKLHDLERELSVSLQLQASVGCVDAEGNELDEDAIARNVARLAEIRRRRDRMHSARDEAEKALKAALVEQEMESLESALALARLAALEGEEDGVVAGDSSRWVVSEVRDVYVALVEAKRADEERLQLGRRQLELAGTSLRSLCLGRDRYGRRYWESERADGEPSLTPTVLVQPRSPDVVGGFSQLPPVELTNGTWPSLLSRDDADTCPAVREVMHDEWLCYDGEEVCLQLAASLDARGVWERALQANIESFVKNMARRRLASTTVGTALED